MAVFRKPSNGKMSKLGDDSLQFESYPMDNIYSPYDGRVISVSMSDCGGNIRIEHNFRGSTLISNLCEVATILVVRGDRVVSGQVVGKLGGNILEYSLEDLRGNKVNPKNFFGESGDLPTENDKDKKTPEPKKPKTSNVGDKDDKEWKVTPGLTVAHQVFADLLASPTKIFKDKKFFKPGKLFKGTKSEDDDSKTKKNFFFNPGKLLRKNEEVEFKKKLTEEIDRIKSLLK